ncbi:hypothetical protein REPUB_Repub10bG0132900 [Reevesia pubescens]
MSTRTISTKLIPPMAARLSAFVQLEKQQQQQLRSLSSRELGSNNPASIVRSHVNSSWSKWGSPNEKLDWSVSGDEMGQLRRSSSFKLGKNGEERNLSWVQDRFCQSFIHSVIGAWLEQMQLDQLVV